MKKIVLGLLSATALMTTTAHAATLAAAPLKCGGYVSIDQNNGQTILSIAKVGQSQCQSFSVESAGYRNMALQMPTTQMRINNLGNQLVVVVNDEVVVLTAGSANNEARRANEIEQRRLEIETERANRERAKQNAENAAAAVAIGAVTAGAAVDGLSSVEH